ncbi:MAG: carboxypeptidase regulatory-like domain-containing protein [Elusimicrobia bacterium]|nr:carboxypeptidase regulatory-like domain-containing protein [Elusimicrobiota bacterium]
MHSFTKLILAAAVAIITAGFVSAATTLNVHVKNQAGVAVGSVTVAAIEFGINGPSTHTQLGLTNAAGNISFILVDNKSYNLYYSSHGYSPSISDQFNNPEYDPNRYVWTNGATRFSTFTVTSGLADVGRLIQEFTGATANKALFGGVYNMASQMQGASGIVVADGSGNGTLVVDNVPYADANTYNIGLYDPEISRGIGRNVMTALNSGTPVISYTGVAKLDFAESIPIPPTRMDNTNVTNTDAASNVSVEGIVRSTETTAWTPIPWNGINIQSCVGGNWSRVDENGRFQLTGLTPGVTYYVEAYGGCTWSDAGPGDCYEPYRSPALLGQQDLCTGAAPKGINDFVYISSSQVQYVAIKLNKVPPSIGKIPVYVKSASGYAIPNANVGINPDSSAWNVTACTSTANWGDNVSNPGFANKNVNVSATGYALLDGLPSGNYMLNIWTPFSQNSASGPAPVNDPAKDGFNWEWNNAHCSGTGVNDIRITVDTNTTPSLQVFDNLGNNLNFSSITVVVETGLNAAGLVKGALKFSSLADLTENPIMITLNPQCNEGGCNAQGNFAIINSSDALSYDYTIAVSTGAAYWLDVRAKNWGRARTGDGDSNVSLRSTGTVTVDMSFVPAGAITGFVYKPDGTVFTPSNNQWVWVNADANNGWAGGQVQKDGSFTIDGALPGVNRIHVEVSGMTSLQYTLPSPAPTVTVTAGVTSGVNINLVNANYVGIALDETKVPDRTIIGSGWNTILGYRVVTLPAGSVLKGETIIKMLTGGGDDQMRFNYSLATSSSANNSPCGPGWPAPGFCAARVPSPALYDFYLMRSGDFGDISQGSVPNAPVPHFVLLSSSKNVIVDNAHATSLVSPVTWNSTVPVNGVLVNLTPTTDMSGWGNAALSGQVTANNFFRQNDYDACGGDFEKFLEFLPIVTLYDGNGVFKAAGIVVPPIDFIAANVANFDLAFAESYAAFKNLLNSAPTFVYEIRGLVPSACYTAVAATPNYPPYQKKICVGVNGSTTTANINLDSAVGSGATVRGVVKDTNTVVLGNIPVEISGEALDTKTIMTSTAGLYLFEGLPAGTVKIKVAAPGYALAEAEKDLVGSNIYAQNFQLTLAGGSITGTVYSQKLPFAKVQAGAQIMAYNDTYNGLNPTKPLPLLKTKTGSDGAYKLTGLVPGDTYKVFLKVPGKYTLSQSVTASTGNTAGIDFTMLTKPLDIEIFVRKGENAYEFTVLNPQDFKTGVATWSISPYGSGTISTMTLTKLSSGELSGKIPLSALITGKTYVLQAVAISYSGKQVVRELLFGKGFKGNADQQIDNAIIGDDSDDGYGRRSNEAAMDKSGGDASALSFPPGAALPVSSAAVPTCSFKGEDKDDSSVAGKVAALGANAFAGDLYTISISSVSINPDKGFDITLAYDKSAADLDDLGIARYNETTGKWETLTGVATINPVKGTIKVKLKSLASVLAVKNGRHTPQFSTFNGREYVVRPSGDSSSAGTFSVIKPSIAGDAFSGSKIKVFNYPNPFNLKNKAISNNHGAALPGAVNGTVIHVEVPAGNGGPGHVRIYTLAGELVKDISVTFEAGKYNYVGWDGLNKGGQEVANGVYYGVVELAGKSPDRKDATFKMAVVK